MNYLLSKSTNLSSNSIIFAFCSILALILKYQHQNSFDRKNATPTPIRSIIKNSIFPISSPLLKYNTHSGILQGVTNG